ncbi:amidophosphoribosyltransferase [candidate division KSB1 bacterium]
MSGIFGIYSSRNCVEDLIWGTSYLQHRGQKFCGWAASSNGKMMYTSHSGKLREKINFREAKDVDANTGIGVVSSGDRQPVSELSRFGEFFLVYDGNIIGAKELKEELLGEGHSFSGYYDPSYIPDTVLIGKILALKGPVDGIEQLSKRISGDYSILLLTKEGLIASRGWGRKPLILGKSEESFVVSSESCAFPNLGIEIERDVNPGEIILIDTKGFSTLKQLSIEPVKYGTFEWVYTANASSVIDGVSVEIFRNKIGAKLAERYPVDADVVSEIPNSGIGYAIGYSNRSGIPHGRIFVKYDYADRSFTQATEEERETEAKRKLIPLNPIIKQKRVIITDDSIVRGTQTKESHVPRLKEAGALEVHARIGCPLLKDKCNYGKTTKKKGEILSVKMGMTNDDDVKVFLGLDSIGFALPEDLAEASGKPLNQLCLSCWGL